MLAHSRSLSTFVVLGAFFGLGLGCTGTSGTSLTPPITGIVVRAESVTEGRGCGRATGNVFKYAAIVYSRADKTLIAGQVYDCFADGAFVDLPPVNGSYDYDLQVFVFNEAAYLAAGGDGRIRGIASDATALRASSPTWTTTCGATQLSYVQALASCGVLKDGLEGLP